MTALEAAQAIARGFRAAGDFTCTLVPMADGGEGTVDVFVAGGAQRRNVRVRGPLGDPVEADFAYRGDLAVIEMAAASGLSLIPAQRRDPMRANTYGTGQLLDAALDAGATHVIVGIGGSATSDVGTGMLRALGARFFDGRGAEIVGPMSAYAATARVDLRGLDARIAHTSIEVAVDVDNPLTGKDGAAAVFAPQKGATPEQAAELDRIAAHVADVFAAQLGKDERNTPGAGAAGGLGFAFVAALGAKLRPGAELIARARGLPEMLARAQLCATGEGKIDMQTLHGKTVMGVAKAAHECGVPVVAFAGKVESDARDALAAQAIETRQSAPPDMPVEEAMAQGAALLERAAYEYAVERR